MFRRIAEHLGRLLRARFAGLLTGERVSNAEWRMQAAIKEADQALAQVREQLGPAAVEQHQAVKAQRQAQQTLADLIRQIEDAAQTGDDAAARQAIAGQLDVEARLPDLEEAAWQATAQVQRLEQHAAALLEQKREAQVGLEAYRAALAEGETTIPKNADRRASERELAQRITQARLQLDRELNAAVERPLATPVDDAAEQAEYEALGRERLIEQRLREAKTRGEPGPAREGKVS